MSDDSQNSAVHTLHHSYARQFTRPPHPRHPSPLYSGVDSLREVSKLPQNMHGRAPVLTSSLSPDQGSLHCACCCPVSAFISSKYLHRGFPGGPVLENPPANAGAMGSLVRATKPGLHNRRPPHGGARALPQLEKALTQQERPGATKNHKIIKYLHIHQLLHSPMEFYKWSTMYSRN